MKRLLLLLPAIIIFFTSFKKSEEITLRQEKPKLCLTFDDGNTSDMPGYTWNEWNNLLLKNLKRNQLQAILFATGQNLDNERGKKVLEVWNKQGHLIGNHSYSHKSYIQPSATFEEFSNDFLRNDSLIHSYSGFVKLFRFPYLKEGETEVKRDQFRSFLKEHQYKNGYVTIDASDWYVNSRMLKRLKKNPDTDLEPYKQYYLNHLYEKAVYYNDLSQKLTGRQISHTLLLHHNLAAALFTDDLVKMFKEKGWEVINVGEAYKDEIYKVTPNTLPAGESLIWAMAREKGGFEDVIRYPAEDSKYEAEKMDKLGL